MSIDELIKGGSDGYRRKWVKDSNGFRRPLILQRTNLDKNDTNNVDSNLKITNEEKDMDAYRKGYRKGIDIDLETQSNSKGEFNLSPNLHLYHCIKYFTIKPL